MIDFAKVKPGDKLRVTGMGTFKPGDYVKKIKGHSFRGWVVSVGNKQNSREVVTVEHDPDEWVFHFRPDELTTCSPLDGVS